MFNGPALELDIPPCIHDPPHVHHPPPPDKPLRIVVQGPLECIHKLLPGTTWHTSNFRYTFPQPAGPKLASLTLQKLYGQETYARIYGGEGEGKRDVVVRDEYLAWVTEGRRGRPFDYIDYYGVTFDLLVPADEPDPEVLCIGLIEMDYDGGAFMREVLPFHVDPAEYTGKKVLSVPRCCQIKKGTQDRERVNMLVVEREKREKEKKEREREREREREKEKTARAENSVYTVETIL